MKQFNKSTKVDKQQGQIVIISLLILAAFSMIGISVATQVVFEQKKASLEQKTKEAYYAAESGIENALQNVLNGATPTPQFNVGRATVNVTTSVQSGAQTFSVPTVLNSGEMFILNLQGYTQNELVICWDNTATSIMGTLFYTNNTLRTTRASYAMNSESGQTPGFEGADVLIASSGNGCTTAETPTSRYYTITLPTVSPTLTYNYLAVWPVYQNAVKMAFKGANGSNLPAQGTVINSQAEVVEGGNKVIRQVKYFVSTVGATNYKYPPSYLLSPVYSVGGVSFGAGRNW